MDKTLDFVIGDQRVMVDDLPKEIRDSVDFFDKMRSEFEEVAYQQAVLNVAITAVRNKVVQDVVKHLGLDKQQPATEAEEQPPMVDGFEEAEVDPKPKQEKKPSK